MKITNTAISALAFVLAVPAFAESGHYLDCENFARPPVTMILQDEPSATTVLVQMTFFDAIDSGPGHHHAPIYLPGKKTEPFRATVRKEGPRTYFEASGFKFVIKLAPTEYGDGSNDFDGRLLEGTLAEGVTLDPMFSCSWKEPVFRSTPPNDRCASNPRCH